MIEEIQDWILNGPYVYARIFLALYVLASLIFLQIFMIRRSSMYVASVPSLIVQLTATVVIQFSVMLLLLYIYRHKFLSTVPEIIAMGAVYWLNYPVLAFLQNLSPSIIGTRKKEVYFFEANHLLVQRCTVMAMLLLFSLLKSKSMGR